MANPIGNKIITTVVRQGVSIIPFTPVSVGVTATLVVSGSNYTSLRFYNAGTAAISLGSISVTTTSSPLILLPGATYIETEGAGANWYAISAVAAQNLYIQGIK